MARKLSSDEKALWARVIATVKPLQGAAARTDASADRPPAGRVRPRPVDRPRPAVAPQSERPLHRERTLDAGWDRRLGRGLVQPDMTVDLHGRSLAAAYHLLDVRLQDAIQSGARVILLVTGKPPQAERWPVARGAIRAAVDDWLAASRHASHIAAVRSAHPRHGGAGALYIVLRRPAAGHRQNS